ncbi:hypothetical protein RhiirB3_394181 [Rhizophagus irregularis]|nr:hypothetical protein RhiirB3_394181 [Rhizophagus irregularis]
MPYITAGLSHIRMSELIRPDFIYIITFFINKFIKTSCEIELCPGLSSLCLGFSLLLICVWYVGWGVGVWVGSAGWEWECGRVGARVGSGSVGVWECESVGWECGWAWECGLGVWECGSVGVWECGSVGVWACGRVRVWVCVWVYLLSI